jgi:D-alanyl-D-alanine carboxypeptidase
VPGVSVRVLRRVWLAACLLSVGCTADASEVASTPTSAPAPPTPPPTSAAITSTSTSRSTTTSTSTSTTTSTSTSTTTTSNTSTTLPGPNLSAPALRAAFATLTAGNLVASLTVLTDGRPLVQLAAGSTNGGTPTTSDTPMVIASVSKLVTALTIARLVQQSLLTVDQPVPWEAMGFAIDPGWAPVTVRDLLDHTSGISVARKTWLDDPGTCAIPLGAVLVAPPAPERGTWVYSNGNYCALGLLIELLTRERYDAAAHRLVLVPAGITGPHLTVDGSGPQDAPYAKGVARLDRLGGAGQWMASTDDIAALLASITAADREVLTWPGVFADQYGWGHTGTVDGAFSCAWVIDGGRSVVAATVSGATPGSGGGVCDLVLPAAAADLGLPYYGEPVRTPE